MLKMTTFKLKHIFASTFLLIVTCKQYSTMNIYSDDDETENISPANNETIGKSSCPDFCRLRSAAMSSRSIVTDENRKWPNATVPYCWASQRFTQAQQYFVKEAMREIEKVSCVRFIEKPVPQLDGHPPIVFINLGGGCPSSHIGRSTTRQQVVNVHECVYNHKFGMVHEFMHVLGINHEHQRHDRDEYIKINWNNIPRWAKHEFEKESQSEFTTFNFPYDFDSLMHYEKNPFGERGKDAFSILKDVGKYKVGQQEHFSKFDILKINAVADCYKEKSC